MLVNYTPVQEFLARKASDALSRKIKTRATVAHVRIDLLDHFLLQGVYIEDQAHDTLLYAGELQVRITDWFIFREKPALHYLAIENTYIHLYRNATSNVWNYDFLSDAFSSGKKDTGKSKSVEFNLEKIEMDNVRFHMDDQWGGEDIDIDVGYSRINGDNLDFKKKIFDLSSIKFRNALVALREYTPGKPKTLHNHANDTVDTTPFNPEKWMVRLPYLSLVNCGFKLTGDTTTAAPGLFDADHLDIQNIQVTASKLSITGDTVRGHVELLQARERCGLIVKNMRSDVSVSPVASICSNLYLETGYSKLKSYYAMQYKRFPDFLDYIDSVVMVAHLRDAVVDERDIAYFAPQLKNLPQVALHVSGDGKGTVANLEGQHLDITDGNTALKGSGSMKGLPDIYKTWITFYDGGISTTGAGILRYVPGLRNSPDVALEQVTYAIFKGRYEGYIQDFAVSGSLFTNLGTITTNLKLDIPGFKSNSAIYSGTVITDKLQLGLFLRQPLLGPVSLKETISGSSFDPDRAQLSLDGNISELGIKGYDYHNIITHGTLAKKQFNGTLLIDDPNLGLEFDGGINYSDKNINVKAVAHLLSSNFKALNLTTDTITASADFDLNCTGSNIDNFSGYAKLNNISMKRNSRRLALDSVFINATQENDSSKLLTLESNDIAARIKGNYQLSKLPISIQYYLSRYIPNYINAPSATPPGQNFEFTVNTRRIDSLFAITFPLVRGFDSSSVSGSLNTAGKKLTLNANVPYGSIGKFHMSDIAISGQGNLDFLGLNVSIDNVAVGDSSINGSLSVTTTVGNDSVAFTIATTTTDTSEDITLNGNILARKDSLFLTLLPSQFYLNQAKWDIAGGSKVVYSDKYLLVQGLVLSSGLQRITAATELQSNDKALVISVENLDLGQFGSWAGFAVYQPDGRVNGTVKINKMFNDIYVSANINATGVKMGTDTVGTINLIGDYDGAKKLIILDPQTGIFRNSSSVTASGNISFDSATHQKLDGNIQFNNAQVSWASPFLAGIMSRMSGSINGSINFGGSAYDPVLDGTVKLVNTGFRVDYIGCNYTIPTAEVSVNNRRISFGNVQVFDSYNNKAILSGHFSHNMFRDMRMHLALASKKFEVMNLTRNDNNLFYGNIIAGVDSFTIRGPFNNIDLSVYNAYPAAKSRFYLPVSSGGDLGTYSYVSFKTYGKDQEKPVRKTKYKINVSIDANLNPLAEMHIVLDESSGDEIMAKGNGRIQLEIPPSNDINITGIYNIDNGFYSFAFKRLGFIRQFKLDEGSTISFNGPFAETNLDVNAIYATKARLIDLLSDNEKTALSGTSDLAEAETSQMVDVKLHMTGSLTSPRLTYNLDLEDQHSQNNVAYRQLQLINYDDQQKIEEVASLLLFSTFIPPNEGIGSGTALAGGLNNAGQIASGVINNMVNKLTGNKQLNVDLRYENYTNGDQNSIAANRNVVSVGVNKNFFSDRLGVEVGSTSDWGHPTSASASSGFNITGDFRIQYLLSYASGVRVNAFRTSDYDVTLDKDIQRSGMGVSWRKSFDNFGDFFKANKSASKEKEEKKLEQSLKEAQDSSAKKANP